MIKYVLDSNIIIDYLASKFKGEQLLRINDIVNDRLFISVITKIEVLGFTSEIEGLDAKTAQFIDLSSIYDLTPEVADKAIEIRKKRKIKLPDAIIAATAIVNNCTLFTANTRDFRAIKGLKVVNPYNL